MSARVYRGLHRVPISGVTKGILGVETIADLGKEVLKVLAKKKPLGAHFLQKQPA